MRKTWRPSTVNQGWLLPPDLREWVPEGHVARGVREVVRRPGSSGDLAGLRTGRGVGAAAL